jgi:amino acid permease
MAETEKISNGLDVHNSRRLNADEAMQLNNKLDMEYKLPITSSRTGTWAHSAFHNVTAIIGAGVLGLPYTFKFLGWYAGIIVLVLSWVISLFTLHQLIDCHEHNGKRFNRYHELGQYALGHRLGSFAVVVPQLIVMIGLGITYSVTGGRSLYRFWGITCSKNELGECNTSFGLSAWIVLFSGIQLIFIQCPNFNALSSISFLAAVMSLSYSTIAIGGSIDQGRQPVEPLVCAPPGGVTEYSATYNHGTDCLSTAAGVFEVFNALGTVAFAYGGHNVCLEIAATLPSPPAVYKPYMSGVWIAYGILTWCYFGVAIAGYWAYGDAVGDNILLSIGSPLWLVAMGNFMVFIHVVGSYQVYTMPVLDMIEMQMVRRRIPNGLVSRLIYRSIYVVLIGFIACTIPFFGDLMGFIGALGTGPTTFWLPAVIWLILKKPSKASWQFWMSWFSIVLGVSVTILGAMGGLRGIITRASSYEFYQ